MLGILNAEYWICWILNEWMNVRTAEYWIMNVGYWITYIEWKNNWMLKILNDVYLINEWMLKILMLDFECWILKDGYWINEWMLELLNTELWMLDIKCCILNEWMNVRTAEYWIMNVGY